MTVDPRVERVRAAHAAALTALAAEEQAIRDVHAAGLPVAVIARDGLGTANRQRVYAVLGRATDGTDPRPPALTPIVYLRGAGRSDEAWHLMRAAMWARGWSTTTVGEDAWHAARAGVPVAHVDFSPRWTGEEIIVARVRGRYTDREDGTVEHEVLLLHQRTHYLRGPVDEAAVQAVALLVADVLA